jgi:4,5-dihydroxyphthalate decarboxylase
MPRLRLSLALSRNPRTAPLAAHQVRVEGLDIDVTTVHPSEMFWRQLKFADFDISEMSMSTLLILTSAAHDRGTKRDWVALPVFTSRRFFHTGALVRTDSGIEKPQDLAGKRVGVPEYQQTAAVWTRGILQDDFGVHPRDVNWHMERVPEISHAGQTGFTPPEGVSITQIERGESIASKLDDGTLDATIMYINDANLVDRSRADLSRHPQIRPLFPNPDAENRRYFEAAGLFPVNHCVVVRRELAEEHPWIVLNVYQAFVAARDHARAPVLEALADYVATGGIDEDARTTLGTDLYPYGVKANRDELDTLCRYAFDQGLTTQLCRAEDIFDERTLSL